MEAQKVTELTIEEEDKEHLHLPLLVSSRCVSFCPSHNLTICMYQKITWSV